MCVHNMTKITNTSECSFTILVYTTRQLEITNSRCNCLLIVHPFPTSNDWCASNYYIIIVFSRIDRCHGLYRHQAQFCLLFGCLFSALLQSFSCNLGHLPNCSAAQQNCHKLYAENYIVFVCVHVCIQLIVQWIGVCSLFGAGWGQPPGDDKLA